MALASTLTQLEQVQTAIAEVLAGQEYRIGDITYKRADLDSLQKREEALLARYNREQRGQATTRANFQGGL